MWIDIKVPKDLIRRLIMTIDKIVIVILFMIMTLSSTCTLINSNTASTTSRHVNGLYYKQTDSDFFFFLLKYT